MGEGANTGGGANSGGGANMGGGASTERSLVPRAVAKQRSSVESEERRGAGKQTEDCAQSDGRRGAGTQARDSSHHSAADQSVSSIFSCCIVE